MDALVVERSVRNTTFKYAIVRSTILMNQLSNSESNHSCEQYESIGMAIFSKYSSSNINVLAFFSYLVKYFEHARELK